MQGLLGQAEELARQRNAKYGMLMPEPSMMDKAGSFARRMFWGENDPKKASLLDQGVLLPDGSRGIPMKGASERYESVMDVFGGPMSFIGRTSNLADRQLLKKAKSMLSKKSPKDQIWDEDAYRATGWFKDIDGQWKFEIDDSKVKVDEGAYKKFRRTPVFQGVGDFIRKMDKGEIPIKHRGSMTRESLMPRDTGYPEIDSGLVYRLPTNKGTLGEIHPDIPVLTGIANPPRGLLPNPVTGVPMHKYGKLGTIKKDMPLFRDNLLHETQHHIAGREGYGIGGNPEMYAEGGILALPEPTPKDMERQLRLLQKHEELRDKLSFYGDKGQVKKFFDVYGDRFNKLEDDLLKERLKFNVADSPIQKYLHSAGEVEARNVETRSLLSPKERVKTLPWDTLDVKRENIHSMSYPQFLKKFEKHKKKRKAKTK